MLPTISFVQYRSRANMALLFIIIIMQSGSISEWKEMERIVEVHFYKDVPRSIVVNEAHAVIQWNIILYLPSLTNMVTFQSSGRVYLHASILENIQDFTTWISSAPMSHSFVTEMLVPICAAITTTTATRDRFQENSIQFIMIVRIKIKRNKYCPNFTFSLKYLFFSRGGTALSTIFQPYQASRRISWNTTCFREETCHQIRLR